MRNAVVVDAVRSPIGRGKPGKGMLSGIHPVDLSATVLNALVTRTGIEPDVVDDVIFGCVTTIGEQSSNIGRWSLLAAGWPDTVPATTVDRACGSSQQTVAFAAAGVMAGQYDIVIAGGVESMSRVPMGATRTSGHGQARGPRITERYGDVEFSQGLAAEMVAEKWSLTRARADEYAAESHARAAVARESGRFDAEIVGIPDGQGGMHVADEGIRPGTNVATLAELKPAFRPDGIVTAGNSSQISDGAAAVLIMAEDVARRHGLTPLARFASFAVTGVDPVLMLTGPITATQQALRRAGLTIDDIDVFEVNEAFATVTLAWLAETGADPARLNPNGGAIALGHPLGATGARLTATLVHHMNATGARYGLQAICEAGGMANAYILERP
ncbi:acetyl-CoA acetyltransferases [Pseudonocardia thermophila]|uniref:Acetyl-CoA acetyltransferases n=1 Tax=Pseudonocardia thermophila TaxID=1848 RepID=A0A1M6WQZ3_PSETH|nr:thiolase family protein [Pseudonocardia thermophila]SHK96091.1 acetyl-CoA acetyltransferases [Pseudonocardia thermophila]